MKHLTILVAALLLAAGCGADFEPYNRLSKLRVLAIRSEPPAPAPGESATLTPLIYTPEGDPPVSYAWSWCPAPGLASSGYPCLVSEDELRQAGAGAAVPAYDLGSGATASFTHGVDPQILQKLCEGLPGASEKPDCEGGFPIQIRVTVSTADEQQVTVSTLRLRLDASAPPNQNPHLEGLAAVLDGTPQAIGDTPTLELPRKVETVIRATVPPEDAELYQGKDSAGNPGEVRERLTLSWFVESGDLHDGRTGFIDGVTSLDDALQDRWKPATVKDYPRDSSRIIVVVRDNRGGVAWLGGAVRLVVAP
jgi:hypothetical protein